MSTKNSVGNGLAGATGTGNFVGSTSPTLVTPTLGAATATSLNLGGTTLSTYSSGSWTPVPSNLTVVGTPTYIGTYVKIGSIVVCSITIDSTTSTTSVSGTTSFSGLPYAAASNGTGDYYNDTSTAYLGTGISTSGATPVIYPPSWSTLASVTSQFIYIATTN